MQFIKSLVFCFISVVVVSVSNSQELPPDFYLSKIQPIFDNRCLACHSCFNAPCQLNLQSFEGFERGASRMNVYDGTRVKSVFPSRMWIDGHTKGDWRKKGFFDVNTSKKADKNLFLNFLNLRQKMAQSEVKKQVSDSQFCPDSHGEFAEIAKERPELGMPYGLPPLTNSELEALTTWVQAGAPGPSGEATSLRDKRTPEIHKQILEWESFLNEKDAEHRLVARYIYEHLFLAHIYFPESQGEFFRLVRSSSACEKGVQEIATRRPNDDPGVKEFFYCLRKFPGTVVEKTHITYAWSPEKLQRYRHLFWAQEWKVKKLPTFEPGVSENPFIAFKDIPVKARYQFLLDDAQFHVNTFIKGPVCNGSMAVNSIQQQFFVFFLSPQSDNMVLSREYDERAQNLLMLPGVWGSDVEIQQTPLFLKKLVEHREAYRKLRAEWQKKINPDGYALKDIWNGDGKNPNAVLTVFRHDDNAVVEKGAIGDLSKTVFVLDYPLLERLVYNLVVNFDVFGNVGHQYLTRHYMDLIRMEAEELFLSFLPPEQRLQYRHEWYRGLLSQALLTYIFPTVGSAEPTGVRFNSEVNTKKQMVEKILFYHLSQEARGNFDVINWKILQPPHSLKFKPQLTKVEKELRKLASVRAQGKTPFARFFSEVSLLKIRDQQGRLQVYSLLHNREHENISWVLGESMRYAPAEDTLTIREGFWGSYPNMIFDVSEKSLAQFTAQVLKMKSEGDYQSLVSKYGVRRNQSTFWSHYDELMEHFKKTQPLEFGYLDLTRYELK